MAGYGSGPVNQMYGSADPDREPYQHVTDPQKNMSESFYYCCVHLPGVSFPYSLSISSIP
jgi:hypothetical protein